LHERVDARPVRQLTALKAADLGLVLDRIGGREPELLGAPALGLPLRGWQRGFHLLRLVARHRGVIGERPLVLAVVRGVALVERHGPSFAANARLTTRRRAHARRAAKLRSTALRTEPVTQR